MICPQCKAEYRPGFTHASDCDVALKRSGSGERHGKKPPVIRSNGFQRAWRGQERLWKIYWVYLILGSVIVMIGSTIVVPLLFPLVGRMATVAAVAPLLYWAWVTICMCRCASNCNWRGWGNIAVAQMVLTWVGIFLNVIAALLHVPPIVKPPIEGP